MSPSLKVNQSVIILRERRFAPRLDARLPEFNATDNIADRHHRPITRALGAIGEIVELAYRSFLINLFANSNEVSGQARLIR
jgi:hypothetical protein